MAEEGDKLLVTAEEAARLLSVSVRTLDGWRAKGTGPPFIKLTGAGRGVRYPVDKMREWIAKQTTDGAP